MSPEEATPNHICQRLRSIPPHHRHRPLHPSCHDPWTPPLARYPNHTLLGRLHSTTHPGRLQPPIHSWLATIPARTSQHHVDRATTTLHRPSRQHRPTPRPQTPQTTMTSLYPTVQRSPRQNQQPHQQQTPVLPASQSSFTTHSPDHSCHSPAALTPWLPRSTLTPGAGVCHVVVRFCLITVKYPSIARLVGGATLIVSFYRE